MGARLEVWGMVGGDRGWWGERGVLVGMVGREPGDSGVGIVEERSWRVCGDGGWGWWEEKGEGMVGRSGHGWSRGGAWGRGEWGW